MRGSVSSAVSSAARERGQRARIRLHRAPRARRITQRGNAPNRKPRQPVCDRLSRASAPAGDARQVVTERRRFDHFQPFAHAARQIGAPQRGLNGRTLLGRDAVRRSRGRKGRGGGSGFVSRHLRAPLLHPLLLDCPTSWLLSRRITGASAAAFCRSHAPKFTSAYLGAIIARAGIPASLMCCRGDSA